MAMLGYKYNKSFKDASYNQSRTPAETLATGLGWFSIALGAIELAAPRQLARAIGLKGRESLIQAYGVREVMTGVAILASHDPTPWIWGRVGGDALDLATLATGVEGENPKKDNTLAAIAAVAGVTLLDIYCAQQLTAQKRLAAPEDRPDYSDRSGYPKPPDQMRGAARDADIPADFRIPDTLRPWTN
jgi:hypothetical protein